MKRCLFIVLILAAFTSMRAQYLDSLDELMKGRYSLDLRLESRNATIDNHLVTRNGFRVGVAFRRKLRMGIGLSWLSTPLISELKPPVIENDSIVHNLFVKLNYVCYYVDVIFYKTKRWQLSVPLQFGTGMQWLEDPLLSPDSRRLDKQFVFLYEPGITVQYKFFKWFGAGADVTYLFLFPRTQQTGRVSLQSLTVKVLFWFDHLYYELFPRSRITKKYGPAYW